ncbi:hypothetical protein HY380_02045 [Candidatus Saccharibacteria bacterium]|nr:hypothetical protein [Candidatus Saccharibacteria bacterium]
MGEESPAPTSAEPTKKVPDRDLKKYLSMIVVAVVLLAIGAAAGWWWRDRDAKSKTNDLQVQITSLQAAQQAANAELAAAKAKNKKQAADSCSGPTATELENIQAAIESGNTAAIESYLLDPVSVILAASEAYGPQTPTEAISDLDYLNAGTDPWDFSLPTATLDNFQSGDYEQYFTDGSLVGMSANNYVVSFQFDGCGSVYQIFMSANEDIL